ncbi:carbon monoxide dehydrogenase [Virgibacillus phasianinus]|uniref:Carbon monoxide dehydrogenase n=1 Tax=Virgibacillus phasianinus TaxID=2017483 RepID=A0A220U3Q2_9BACI|nr:SRPBCC family protein [Virgibacillus phasianinus]ASK62546.1 carbon monoxide dehydrogenase [Virgibacillus phasianinus]
MPNGIYQLELDIPIKNVWFFVSDMNNWAPLVPGYMEHTILNARQSTWDFKGDIGFMQKKVSLQIDITKWQKPTTVTFDLKGLNENFKGDGYFRAEAITSGKTRMTGYMNINAKGMMGPMINSFLKSFVPKTTKELTEAVGEKVNEIEVIAT